MVWSTLQSAAETSVWALVRRQHGVIDHRQLVDLGYSRRAIEHRLRLGRLHCLFRGVYAVGRFEISTLGRLMAAVLACGDGAFVSHDSAAALCRIRSKHPQVIHVSVPWPRNPCHPGIRVHRRRTFDPRHLTVHQGIPVTTPTVTLVDLATQLGRDSLEAAINEADKQHLIDPEALRAALAAFPALPGAARLRATLDARTFTLTDSELERRFLPIARRAGLPRPQTQVPLNGFRVDFFWPELGLVVETDGLRYHRTPAQQANDRLRDQVHTAAGLTPVRFTRAQVRYEQAHVEATLAAVAERLSRPAAGRS
jgi:very-short-patch-repair endonuclease/predicted transcriptional regulator of viral defense system